MLKNYYFSFHKYNRYYVLPFLYRRKYCESPIFDNIHILLQDKNIYRAEKEAKLNITKFTNNYTDKELDIIESLSINLFNNDNVDNAWYWVSFLEKLKKPLSKPLYEAITSSYLKRNCSEGIKQTITHMENSNTYIDYYHYESMMICKIMEGLPYINIFKQIINEKIYELRLSHYINILQAYVNSKFLNEFEEFLTIANDNIPDFESKLSVKPLLLLLDCRRNDETLAKIRFDNIKNISVIGMGEYISLLLRNDKLDEALSYLPKFTSKNHHLSIYLEIIIKYLIDKGDIEKASTWGKSIKHGKIGSRAITHFLLYYLENYNKKELIFWFSKLGIEKKYLSNYIKQELQQHNFSFERPLDNIPPQVLFSKLCLK